MTTILVRPNGRGGQHVFVDGVDIAPTIAFDGFSATIEGGQTNVRITLLHVNPDLTIEGDDGVVIYSSPDLP